MNFEAEAVRGGKARGVAWGEVVDADREAVVEAGEINLARGLLGTVSAQAVGTKNRM